MIIGIIGAMEEEVKQLTLLMEIEKKVTKANMIFFKGKLYNKNVVVVTSGIGKVNAAVCTQLLIDNFNVDKVINVGIAGGLHKDIFPTDIIVATNVVQHDVDVTHFGYPLGEIPRMDTLEFKCDSSLIELANMSCETIKNIKYYTGRVVSGDQFISDSEKLESLYNTFNAYCCEMEGASIGQVCFLNNIPFIIIRSISDNAINGSKMDYEKFSEIAIENALIILKNMLQNI